MQLNIPKPLIVTFQQGARRMAVLAFPHPDGACFVDPWWDCPESHPFHILEGELEKQADGSYAVGRCTIGKLTEDEPEWDEWKRWLLHLENGGSHLTEQMAIEAAARDGAVID